jgi:four helix bundle protein
VFGVCSLAFCVFLPAKVFIMATIKRFEDLETWQLAREFANSIYQLTLEEKFSKEYKFKEQLKGSSGSVMDNIAEGFGRGSRLEFINFLGFAKGSLNEPKSQLYRALDYKLIQNEFFEQLYSKAELISAKISSFIIYLNKTEIKGQKFKDRT